MRNKAPLALMELLIMLFVFALCLQAFSLSNRISAKNEARDHAVVQAQNAAELFQYYEGDGRSAASDHGGSWDGSTWRIHFDRQWNMVPQTVRTACKSRSQNPGMTCWAAPASP